MQQKQSDIKNQLKYKIYNGADCVRREKAFDCGNYDNYQINFKL